jgi:hypothetical protein
MIDPDRARTITVYSITTNRRNAIRLRADAEVVEDQIAAWCRTRADQLDEDADQAEMMLREDHPEWMATEYEQLVARIDTAIDEEE